MPKCESCSGQFFVKPMPQEDGYLDEYNKIITELIQQGSLPDLKKEMLYNVYSIKGSDFGAHKSIVLTADDRKFFTVEIGFITINGEEHVYPTTRPLTWSAKLKDKLDFHGQVSTTGLDLLKKGVATVMYFGWYSKLCNNCQDFCNYFLKSIDLCDQATFTDGDKAVVGGILGLLGLVGIAKLISSMYKNRQ